MSTQLGKILWATTQMKGPALDGSLDEVSTVNGEDKHIGT